MNNVNYINFSLNLFCCKECFNKMKIEDVDWRLKGYQDVYYVCENCGTSAVKKIRNYEVINIEWNEKNETN